jgi:hypothetical protein
VVGGHLVLAQALAQLVGHPLGQLPGVDEDEGGPVVRHVGRNAVDDLGPVVAGRSGLELAVR